MSNSNDPTAITTAIDDAEDAFDHVSTFGQPTYEDDIDTDEDWITQLTKACQLIDGTRTIRNHNGHYTAIVELSFGAIERSLEAWLLDRTGNEVEDFDNHEDAYMRVDQQGLFTDGTGRALLNLYHPNRNESYYAERVPTEEQADAMFALAQAVHDHVVNDIDRGYCHC